MNLSDDLSEDFDPPAIAGGWFAEPRSHPISDFSPDDPRDNSWAIAREKAHVSYGAGAGVHYRIGDQRLSLGGEVRVGRTAGILTNPKLKINTFFGPRLEFDISGKTSPSGPGTHISGRIFVAPNCHFTYERSKPLKSKTRHKVVDRMEFTTKIPTECSGIILPPEGELSVGVFRLPSEGLRLQGFYVAPKLTSYAYSPLFKVFLQGSKDQIRFNLATFHFTEVEAPKNKRVIKGQSSSVEHQRTHFVTLEESVPLSRDLSPESLQLSSGGGSYVPF